MNSVALPASATTNALGAEADLVRQAARGDAEAFGELFRRHSAPAWRLAQAVTFDRDGAVAAFRDGFARAVKAGRFGRKVADSFRPQVLTSVYRSAIDQAYDRTATPTATRRSAAGPEVALADAAFRSLPERWRAALWLREVENFDAERTGEVLGVSAAVADQLLSRGRRGLAGRFAQAHQEAPEHLGEVLRKLAPAAPANLAEATAARWSSAGAERSPVFAPVGAWLEDRATRPMSVAVGALIGLGLIGLGVVPNSGAVRGQLSASGTSPVGGAVPVQTCFGIACPGGATPSGHGTLALSFGGAGAGGAAGGTGAGSGLGGSGATGGGGGGGGGGSSYVGPTSSNSTNPGSSTSGGGTPPPPPSNSTPTTTVPVAPIGTVTLGGSSLVGASTGGTTVGVVCSNGLICTSSTTAPATTTTTVAPTTTTTTTIPVIGPVVSTVTSILPTATTLPGGL
jgi:DNA-directed RNA polymerase specialized sigma24 family protein